MNCAFVAALLALSAVPIPGTTGSVGRRSPIWNLAMRRECRPARVRLETIAAQAAEDGDGEWKIFAAWKLACCDFELGNYGAAQNHLEALLKAHPDSGLRLLIHRDLGEFYLRTWKTEPAIAQLDKALRLAPRWSFREKNLTIETLAQIRIQLLRAECFATAGANDSAEIQLKAVRQQILNELANQPANSENAEYLLADCDQYLAEIERRKGATLDAIAREKEALRRLRPFASVTSLRLQFDARIFVARSYSKLTRFVDASAELESVAALLRAQFNEKLSGILDNARAEVQIESILCDFEDNPQQEGLLKRVDVAEHLADSALAHHETASQRQAIEGAACLHSLAKVEELRGRILASRQADEDARLAYQKAKLWADDAIAGFRAILPAGHDILLELGRSHAGLLLELGDLATARSEAMDVLDQFVDRYGSDSVDCVPSQQLLIEIESRAGNVEQAAEHARQHRRLTNAILPAYVTGLTAAEQQMFFRRWDDPGLHSSLRLATRDKSLGEISAEWLLNGKAKAAEVLASVSQQAHGTAEFARFRAAVEHQAFCLYGPRDPDSLSKLLGDEKTKRDLAEKRRSKVPPQWRDFRSLRGRLADDEALIDIFCLNSETNSRRVYWAWVVTSTDPVKIVELGDARPIERLVDQLLQRLEQFNVVGSTEYDSGPAQGEKELHRDCLQPLSELILWPVQKAAQGKSRWVISPDGPLWNVPWAALLNEQDEYVIRDLTLRFAVSGRDLFASSSPARLGPSLVIADPAYNAEPLGMAGSIRRVSSRALKLQESRREGEEVAACLARIHYEPVLKMQTEATKETLVNLMLAPRVLYLSTHGFLAPANKTRVADPFLCCGILLAGYNCLPASDSRAGAKLPGLLTGAEVLNLNLLGTELVVLSACQTGSGLATYGHSAVSLRQAFHLAGAKAVVASLWSVDATTTKDLMTALMENLVAPDCDKADALRSAQLGLIDKLGRSPAKHAHPFLWAAFTLSGR